MAVRPERTHGKKPMSGLRRCHTCGKLVRIADAGPENALDLPRHYCKEHDPHQKPHKKPEEPKHG